MARQGEGFWARLNEAILCVRPRVITIADPQVCPQKINKYAKRKPEMGISTQMQDVRSVTVPAVIFQSLKKF